MMNKVWLLLAVALSLLCLAFDPSNNPTRPSDPEPHHKRLLEIEATLLAAESNDADDRQGTHNGVAAFGAEPYRIRRLPKTDRYLVLLKNAGKVALCNGDLEVVDSIDAPRQPVALDLVGESLLLVGGELLGSVHRYKIGTDHIQALPPIELPGVVTIRDLVYVPKTGTLFVIDDFTRQLVQVKLLSIASSKPVVQQDHRSFPIGAGPLRMMHMANHLIINLMLEHTLLIIPVKGGAPDLGQATRIVNAGPFWSMDAVMAGERLVIAAGGVENRPLSRLSGEFGYLDSFLYLFTLEKDPLDRFRWHPEHRRQGHRYQAANLSALGVLTPKAIAFLTGDTSMQKLLVTGYGSDKGLEFNVTSTGVDLLREFRLIPGISDMVVSSNQQGADWVCTSPLLDRIVKLDSDSGRILKASNWPPMDARKRPSASLLGEILFFTDLMTPNNSSQGELSRFTCEACHFEGHIDGRIHFTGRGNIHTTTKPLHGLTNNLPLFSRGGDDSLSSMVAAEFQVANQHRNGRFEIHKAQYPWMSTLDDWPDTLTPLAQREGLITFFSMFRHEPNPWRTKYRTLSEGAKRGLKVFKERCSDCHQPIRSTRSGHGVEYEQWAHWLTTDHRDLVWGAPFFARTGVTPYVDSSGSRVPSLRRVWMKYPLFTNGSARTVRDVLKGFRYQGATVWHHLDRSESGAATDATPLTPGEMDDLEMLLRYF